MSIAALKNNDIRLFLDTLQINPTVSTQKSCRALVENTLTGKLYLGALDSKYEVYKQMPSAAPGQGATLPLTDEFIQADQNHDGVIWFVRSYGEAVVADPLAPPTYKAAAQRILDQFAPASVTASYVDQAGKYPHYRRMVEDMSEDLTLFPVAWQGPGRTLKDALVFLAETTEKMADLLHERSHVLGSEPDYSAYRTIRMETIRLISQFREAMAVEIAHDSSLPRDLETQVFGFLDSLVKHRAAQLTKPEPKAQPSEPSS